MPPGDLIAGSGLIALFVVMLLKEIDVLISWAEADAEHAQENDAEETAADDRFRAANLRVAKILLQDCER